MAVRQKSDLVQNLVPVPPLRTHWYKVWYKVDGVLSRQGLVQGCLGPHWYKVRAAIWCKAPRPPSGSKWSHHFAEFMHSRKCLAIRSIAWYKVGTRLVQGPRSIGPLPPKTLGPSGPAQRSSQLELTSGARPPTLVQGSRGSLVQGCRDCFGTRSGTRLSPRGCWNKVWYKVVPILR